MDAYPELKLAAAERLGETEEKVQETLLELRVLLGKLPQEEQPADMSDAYLLRFLRARKFRVEQACQVIKDAAAFEREHPQWFKDLTSGEQFRDLYKSGFMRILTKKDKVGRRVSILLPSKLPAKLDGDTMMRWNVWSLGRMAKDPYFCVLGATILENFDTFSFGQAMAMNKSLPSSYMSKSFYFIQRCAAYRLGAIVVLKQPLYMSIIWAIARPFMSSKMRSRVHFLGDDMAKLHTEIMDPADLPPEFGGTSTETTSLGSTSSWSWRREACEASVVAIHSSQIGAYVD